MKFIVIMLLALVIIPVANASSKQEIKKINRYLQSTPMRGTGKIIVHQAKKYDLNPTFVAAVAGKESSFGAASCSRNPKNVWGLGACGRAWNPPYFKSWVSAVNYFVRFIDQRWPSASSPFQFYGYCQGCESEWGRSVAQHMQNMGGTLRVR